MQAGGLLQIRSGLGGAQAQGRPCGRPQVRQGKASQPWQLALARSRAALPPPPHAHDCHTIHSQRLSVTVNAQAAGAAAGTSGRGAEGAAAALSAAPAPSASAAFGLAQPAEQEPSWLCTATGGGDTGGSGAAGGGSGSGAGGSGGNGESSSDDDNEEFLDLQQVGWLGDEGMVMVVPLACTCRLPMSTARCSLGSGHAWVAGRPRACCPHLLFTGHRFVQPCGRTLQQQPCCSLALRRPAPNYSPPHSPCLQAQELAAAKGVSLPEDFAAAAASGGLRAAVLDTYCKLASGGFLTSWLVKALPAFRDRLIADRLFFFKVWAEVAIDSGALLLVGWLDMCSGRLHSSWCCVRPCLAVVMCALACHACLLPPACTPCALMCPAPHPPPFCPPPPACATVAEVRKRGDEFWSEFEFYLSDLLVRQATGTVVASAVLQGTNVLGQRLPATCLLVIQAMRRWLQMLWRTTFAHVCPASCFPCSVQVGLVLDVVLVTLIAPVAQPGRKTAQAGPIREGC